MTEKKQCDRYVWYAAYLYVVIPFLIFLTGWLSSLYALVASGIIIISLVYSCRSDTMYVKVPLHKNRRPLVMSLAVLFIWVLFSGIGGVSYQNEDYYLRNAFLHDLVTSDWPLVYTAGGYSSNGVQPGHYMLVYYIGFWMPSALVGKYLGWPAANIFLFLWSLAGIIMVFYFLCRYLRTCSFKVCLLFVLFSGMDVVYLLCTGNYYPFAHMEWWAGKVQYSSNTTLLYWVFNQTIVPWLVVAMLMNKVPLQNLLFLVALTFFFAPFPFIGLLPFALYFILRERTGNIFDLYIKLGSFQNIAGSLVVIAIVGMYYAGNNAPQSIRFHSPEIRMYLLFVLFEFLALSIVLFVENKTNKLLVICVIILLMLPFIQFRDTKDFTMRASVPALFILMFYAGQCLVDRHTRGVPLKILYVLLIIGSVTPLHEGGRSVYYTGRYYYRAVMNLPKEPLERKGEVFLIYDPTYYLGNTRTSFFYRYLSRKPEKTVAVRLRETQ